MPEPKDYSNIIPELEPFYIEVGRIASAWANMEFHMDRLLWDLAEGQHMLSLVSPANFQTPAQECAPLLEWFVCAMALQNSSKN